MKEVRQTLVVLVPVLRRPHRVAPLLDSIEATSPVDTEILFICDPDDSEEQAAVHREIVHRSRRAGCPLRTVSCLHYDGNYAGKINAGFRHTVDKNVTNGGAEGRVKEDRLFFLGADDLLFHPGWFEAAVAQLKRGVGVVGTNDLGSPRVMAGEHSTHSLVTRLYALRGTIDDPDKVLHEGYPHEFVDDEFVQTAKKRGAFAFAADSHVEHLHPNWGKAESDPLYAAQRLRMKAGRRVFRSREHLWA